MKNLFAFLMVLAIPTFVFAHAYVDHADPKVGADLTARPPSVRIWFTEEIEPDSCAIAVFDSNGNEVDRKDSHGDANDKTLLTVSLNPIPSGKYEVQWHALCIFGHHTKGDFHFTVTPK